LPEGGEVALKMDYDHKTKRASIKGYAVAAGKGFSKKGVRNTYVTEAIMHSEVEDNDRAKVESFFLGSYCRKTENPEEKNRGEPTAAVYGKYKPVALKVKPVYTELPDEYRIRREIKGDPLTDMPHLNPNPLEFVPTGRYTQERKDDFGKVHSGTFLLPEERKLVHHIMSEQNQALPEMILKEGVSGRISFPQ
jgi:hypothetical protein